MTYANGTPLVSIGLPVYNGQNYLREAIESLRQQSFRNFEIVICDNASTDLTADICAHYVELDKRIRYYRNDINLGAAPNFNRSFTLARGKYFKWAAHDDICLPHYLSACVEHLERNPEICSCHTETEFIDAEGRVIFRYSVDDNMFSSADPIERFANAIDENHWCISVFGVTRVDVLRKSTLIGSYVGSDRNLIAQISLVGRIETLPTLQFQSRDHSDRSVRAITLRDRGRWFDTSNTESGRYYHLRLLREHVLALSCAPIGVGNRIRGLIAVSRWIYTVKRPLLREIGSDILSSISSLWRT